MPAKKSVRKHPARKRTPKAANPPASAQPGSPKWVTTGSGMSAEDIGKRLVADFNHGKFNINDKLWSPKLVSIEGGGLAWHGIKNVEAKNAQWNAANIVLGASAEGPYVG